MPAPYVVGFSGFRPELLPAVGAPARGTLALTQGEVNNA